MWEIKLKDSLKPFRDPGLCSHIGFWIIHSSLRMGQNLAGWWEWSRLGTKCCTTLELLLPQLLLLGLVPVRIRQKTRAEQSELVCLGTQCLPLFPSIFSKGRDGTSFLVHLCGCLKGLCLNTGQSDCRAVCLFVEQYGKKTEAVKTTSLPSVPQGTFFIKFGSSSFIRNQQTTAQSGWPWKLFKQLN